MTEEIGFQQTDDKAAILLLAFNRPVITRQVLEAIGRYAPVHLFVGVDGPRHAHTADAVNCLEVKNSIDEWALAHPDTTVHRLYQENNLGCGKGVSTAISWFFSKVESGIILEDDCLPDPSFFTFCASLLQKYRDNPRVMHIAGSNYLNNGIIVEESYYFSKYPHIWGWASWRRAWNYYDYDMHRFPELLRLSDFKRYYDPEVFRLTKEKKIDTWDSQWVCAFLLADGLSVVPTGNLVRNLGFDAFAGTHLQKKPAWYRDEITPLTILVHPAGIDQLRVADDYVFNKAYRRSPYAKLKTFIWKLLFKKN